MGQQPRCVIDGCPMPQKCGEEYHGLCSMHYRYLVLRGDPNEAPLEWLQKVDRYANEKWNIK